jgi:hypothetical protein
MTGRAWADILNKTIVLVLNRNWQAINIRTPQDAFCQMATNVATALDLLGGLRCHRLLCRPSPGLENAPGRGRASGGFWSGWRVARASRIPLASKWSVSAGRGRETPAPQRRAFRGCEETPLVAATSRAGLRAEEAQVAPGTTRYVWA